MKHVKVDFRQLDKTLSAGNRKKAQVVLANQMLADMNPFVPKKENTLRQTGHISLDGSELIWSTLYANAQYQGTNGIAIFRTYSEPGTGPRWDEAAAKIHMERWERVYTRGLGL